MHGCHRTNYVLAMAPGSTHQNSNSNCGHSVVKTYCTDDWTMYPTMYYFLGLPVLYFRAQEAANSALVGINGGGKEASLGPSSNEAFPFGIPTPGCDTPKACDTCVVVPLVPFCIRSPVLLGCITPPGGAACEMGVMTWSCLIGLCTPGMYPYDTAP